MPRPKTRSGQKLERPETVIKRGLCSVCEEKIGCQSNVDKGWWISDVAIAERVRDDFVVMLRIELQYLVETQSNRGDVDIQCCCNLL